MEESTTLCWNCCQITVVASDVYIHPQGAGLRTTRIISHRPIDNRGQRLLVIISENWSWPRDLEVQTGIFHYQSPEPFRHRSTHSVSLLYNDSWPIALVQSPAILSDLTWSSMPSWIPLSDFRELMVNESKTFPASSFTFSHQRTVAGMSNKGPAWKLVYYKWFIGLINSLKLSTSFPSPSPQGLIQLLYKHFVPHIM